MGSDTDDDDQPLLRHRRHRGDRAGHAAHLATKDEVVALPPRHRHRQETALSIAGEDEVVALPPRTRAPAPVRLTATLAQDKIDKMPIKGVLNQRPSADDGGVEYKVRYQGLAKNFDDWVPASDVEPSLVQKFEARRQEATRTARGATPSPQSSPEKPTEPVEPEPEPEPEPQERALRKRKKNANEGGALCCGSSPRGKKVAEPVAVVPPVPPPLCSVTAEKIKLKAHPGKFSPPTKYTDESGIEVAHKSVIKVGTMLALMLAPPGNGGLVAEENRKGERWIRVQLPQLPSDAQFSWARHRWRTGCPRQHWTSART